ncbi:MAG TPA: hypothetical protein VKD22_04475, partial [Ramlibacter sp.]|nr:hypothetical protein [Ramlibacter sp.]
AGLVFALYAAGITECAADLVRRANPWTPCCITSYPITAKPLKPAHRYNLRPRAQEDARAGR